VNTSSDEYFRATRIKLEWNVYARLICCYYLPAGLLKTYHAKNEYCLFSDMAQGFQVFASIISQLEEEV